MSVKLSWKWYSGYNSTAYGRWAKKNIRFAGFSENGRDICIYGWTGKIFGRNFDWGCGKDNLIYGFGWCGWNSWKAWYRDKKWDRKKTWWWRGGRRKNASLIWWGWNWQIHDDKLCMHKERAFGKTGDEWTCPSGRWKWQYNDYLCWRRVVEVCRCNRFEGFNYG